MKIKLVLVVFSVLCLSASLYNGSSAFSTQKEVINSINEGIETCNQWKNSNQNEKAYYLQLRKAFKQIETIVMFRYPTLAKKLNGGPVPSIETEAVILKIDQPTGLQVIEELLTNNEFKDNQKSFQLNQIIKALEQVKSGLVAVPLQNWEILDASHLSITSLITLGLSGFDSPEFDLRFKDAEVVLNQMAEMLSSYNKNEAVLQLLEEAKDQLSKDNKSESFDYYSLIKETLIPLQIEIRKLHNELGYEQYSEVTTIPRMISTGDHLFHSNYLSNTYSMRGNYNNLNPKQVELGKTLFFDPILSENNLRSCASCHKPNLAYTDGNKTSLGNGLEKSTLRNSPTLINSSYQTSFFADLRSKDMNHQILNVINDKLEFNTTPDKIVQRLNQSSEYQLLFADAYNEQDAPVNINNVKAALESFIRTLNTHNSKFDKNIRSESNNFTEQEVKGFNLFFGKAECATCHFAPHFNGLVPPHFNETEGEILGVTTDSTFAKLDDDWGVYRQYGMAYPNATETKGMFKTPTLRNISITAPYMHNGGLASLESVLEFYNSGGGSGNGLGVPQQTLSPDSLSLSEVDKQALIAFLKTLTDTIGTGVQSFVLPIVENEKLQKRKWGGQY
ncbi:MAG: cytochrome-c peroxidase [Salibacteraceae bacterium]